MKSELQGIIDEMLSDKIFRHSSSPWNSPNICVKKKEDASQQEKLRLVVDFLRLNEVTVDDSPSTPNFGYFRSPEKSTILYYC